MMSVLDTKQLLSKQYDFLGHKDGDVTVVRELPSGANYYCQDKEQFVETCLPLLEGNVYVGLNPRKSATPGGLLDVGAITCICVDIDPTRPKDTGSTEEQHRGSIEIGTRIAEDFGSQTSACVVSSGSGCHVYLPIERVEVTNAEILNENVKAWGALLQKKYAKEGYKIDSIFDLPRIIRVWGSNNSRSKRVCTPITQVDNIRRYAVSFSQEAQKKETPKKDATTELEQRFHRLTAANKKLKGLVEGSELYPSKSECDAAFIQTLSHARFTPDEIESLYHYNVNGQSKQGKEIRKDIDRVIKRYEGENDQRAVSMARFSATYLANLRTRKMGYRSGFHTLDEMISGFKEGKIYIFGARPGTGKTTFLTQILTNFAEQGIPSLFFPTEVGAEPIIDKILSRKCDIDLKKFQNGAFRPFELEAVEKQEAYIKSLPLIIYEDFGVNVDQYEREIDKYAPKVVCLDYFQALKWDDPSNLGEKEEAVRRIKKITQDRNIVTICLSQLNRNAQGKAGMAELKGTGALEEYADVIGQMYKTEVPGYPLGIDLTVTKSKYSATGNISMQFFNNNAYFAEAESNNAIKRS